MTWVLKEFEEVSMRNYIVDLRKCNNETSSNYRSKLGELANIDGNAGLLVLGENSVCGYNVDEEMFKTSIKELVETNGVIGGYYKIGNSDLFPTFINLWAPIKDIDEELIKFCELSEEEGRRILESRIRVKAAKRKVVHKDEIMIDFSSMSKSEIDKFNMYRKEKLA